MSEYSKPLPHIDERSRPFWEAAGRRELRLPRCRSCGHHRTTFEDTCPRCLGQEHDWALLSGRGKVWSFCLFHKVYFRGFAEDIPYNVGLVHLEEGPLLVTNLVDIPSTDIRIGMSVEPVFEKVAPEVTLIKFRPDGNDDGVVVSQSEEGRRP